MSEQLLKWVSFLGVERLAGRILVVVILDVVHVLADDGDGVGADFDVLGGAAGREGQKEEINESFHNGLYLNSSSFAPPRSR